MTALTLAAAKTIIDAAFAKGEELELRPLGVSVLDAGGHLVAFQRQDGASFLRPQMSAGKAYGAVAIGMGGRRLEAFAKDRPHLMAGISDVSGSKILSVVGGVLIRDGAGTILGAVGISGDSSENDEAAAIAGIEAAGFTADPG
ncbi:heme-binding protein [Mesorhizobium sp. 8]|uniref:GlcG/HbpS family heme-binding protein n=1 Tax=Mesorhizobium sp. 8 TaxID=2584466 RepID=UPI00111E31BD|nr:heme-binding protein [Mesorhizobium sp. 8]QDC01486.1 heme-binding protein [Mesorhizobium sp. 8]